MARYVFCGSRGGRQAATIRYVALRAPLFLVHAAPIGIGATQPRYVTLRVVAA